LSRSGEAFGREVRARFQPLTSPLIFRADLRGSRRSGARSRLLPWRGEDRESPPAAIFVIPERPKVMNPRPRSGRGGPRPRERAARPYRGGGEAQPHSPTSPLIFRADLRGLRRSGARSRLLPWRGEEKGPGVSAGAPSVVASR